MKFVFFNDKIIPLKQAQVNVRDLSLLRGFGIFDFLRTWKGRPLFLQEYLDRFYASAEKMGLLIPQAQSAIPAIINELLDLHKYPESGIRLLLTGGESQNALSPGLANFVIYIEPFKLPPNEDYENGIKVLSVPYQRFMPEIKSINYMPLIYHRNSLEQSGAEDVLYHNNGVVSELSRCNIFFVKNGAIFTNESGILYGITRKKVLELAAKKYPIHFDSISLEDLFNADEVFLSSTTKQVMPITQIDDQLINAGKAGVISKEVKLMLEESYGG